MTTPTYCPKSSTLCGGFRYTHTLCIQQQILIPNAPVILCFIEVNFGIICASVPAVRPFFSRFIPVLLSSRRKQNESGSSGPSDRVVDTIEKKNKERQNLKRRNNVGPEESYDMSSFGTDTTRYLDSSNDDEESRLWPAPAPNKSHGYSKVTEAP